MSTKTDMSREAVTHRLRQMEGLWLLSKALAGAKIVQKNGAGKNRGLEIQASIRDILLRESNPAGTTGADRVDRSCDRHIAPILRILVGSRSENDLIECLRQITNTETASETLDMERLQLMAKSLLELNVKLN